MFEPGTFDIKKVLGPMDLDVMREKSLMYGNRSAESMIYDRILAFSVEAGPGRGDDVRRRISELVSVFKIAAIGQMSPWEQELYTREEEIDPNTYVSPGTIQDIHWIWSRFELLPPKDPMIRGWLGFAV